MRQCEDGAELAAPAKQAPGPATSKTKRVGTIYRPLRGRNYFLHVKATEEEHLAKKIKRLGGAIASVLDDVYAVITDDSFYIKFISSLNSDGCNSGRNSVCSSAAGIAENPSQTILCFPDSAYSSNLPSSKQGNVSSNYNKYYFKMPSVLRQAYDLRLKIITLNHFLQILQEIEKKLTALKARRRYKAPATPQKNSQKKISLKTITKLNPPYLKFEDRKRIYCPVYKHFSQWPFLTIRPGGKGCPFERKQQNRHVTEENPSENRKKPAIDQKPKILRRKLNGYCDLCQCWADKMAEHINSEIHLKNSTSKEIYKTFDDFIQRERLSIDVFLQRTILKDTMKIDEENSLQNNQLNSNIDRQPPDLIAILGSYINNGDGLTFSSTDPFMSNLLKDGRIEEPKEAADESSQSLDEELKMSPKILGKTNEKSSFTLQEVVFEPLELCIVSPMKLKRRKITSENDNKDDEWECLKGKSESAPTSNTPSAALSPLENT